MRLRLELRPKPRIGSRATALAVLPPIQLNPGLALRLCAEFSQKLSMYIEYMTNEMPVNGAQQRRKQNYKTSKII